MSFRPPGYGYYYYYSNGSHRTVVMNDDSDIPIRGDGLAAQQPFPNSVRIKFSAPPLKQLKKSHRFSKSFFVISLVLIVILLFEKRSIVGNAIFSSNGFFTSNGWPKPEIPWKGPKEFEIDPQEFNSLEITVSGQAAQGNLVVTRSSNSNTSLINVKAQILLSHEYLQDKVEILPFYDSSNYHLQVKTPEFCVYPDCILTNINITFPRNLKDFDKFLINVINLNIINDLKDITFDSINWKLSPSIDVKDLKSREITIHSSGGISGNYYIDDSLLLQTSNSKINATARSFTNSTPKSIRIFTSNSAIQGSFPSAHLFEAHTSNGKIDLNVKSASQNKHQNSGKVILNTDNGNISGEYDVSSEWHASTSNGSINVKLNLVNSTELIRISGVASNGKIDTFISDSYKGRFHLQTSNGISTIRGSNDNINYDVNSRSLKTGYKGAYNNNELSLLSSNGKIDLNFFRN